VDVADDGTFLFREAVRINFGHLVAQQFNGDTVWVSARVFGSRLAADFGSLLQFCVSSCRAAPGALACVAACHWPQAHCKQRLSMFGSHTACLCCSLPALRLCGV
jgi:hypothetical protein